MAVLTAEESATRRGWRRGRACGALRWRRGDYGCVLLRHLRDNGAEVQVSNITTGGLRAPGSQLSAAHISTRAAPSVNQSERPPCSMPPAAVLQRTWHDAGPRRFGGEGFWNTTKAYSAAEARAFEALPAPRNLNSTQAAQAGWPRVFERKLPRRLPPAAICDAWFEWLSERCHLIIEGRLYDGKIMHIIVKPRPIFFVLVSHRDGATGPWTHELWRVPVKGTRQRPFDGTRGAAWPGPDEMQAPGHPSSDLEALFPDGSERYVADAWTRPIAELVVAVGPAPHLYFEVKHRDGAQVWVEDDGWSILVKDSDRPKLYKGYQGDEKGRYSRTWLNKDRVKAVTKSSVNWIGGDVWRRRNAAVLNARWKGFKNVESWFKGELLFDYDFDDEPRSGTRRECAAWALGSTPRRRSRTAMKGGRYDGMAGRWHAPHHRCCSPATRTCALSASPRAALGGGLTQGGPRAALCLRSRRRCLRQGSRSGGVP